MSPKHVTAGPLEVRVLRLLEEGGEQAVQDIQIALKAQGEALAYTTVMTVLSRLFEKGYLRRRKKGRQYVYQLRPQKEKIGQELLLKFKSALFGKDRLKPILALLENEEDLSIEELKALRAAVNARIRNEEGGFS